MLVLGLGPIGQAVTREIVRAPDLKLAGAIDPAPELAGRPLADVLREPDLPGKVLPSLASFGKRRADVAVHMAASRFAPARAQIAELLERRLSVVTTCEEMIAALHIRPRAAGDLDRRARAAGLCVLATGVNPGFVMDALPAAVANVCVSVRSVRVERWVDTSKRRRALQLKTGLGLSAREFRRRARENRVGHVGLRDSLVFLMNHLPLEGEVGDETIRPILAGGEVIGVHQIVRARAPGSGRVVASFDLRMAYGLEDAHDRIRIAGDPPVDLRFEGGVPGDRATVGAVLSTIRYVPHATPGLGT